VQQHNLLNQVIQEHMDLVIQVVQAQHLLQQMLVVAVEVQEQQDQQVVQLLVMLAQVV
tara:strand:+ start:198 stop:371 length:174 start_codon:yes stop_codon:yes gene_type:complete